MALAWLVSSIQKFNISAPLQCFEHMFLFPRKRHILKLRRKLSPVCWAALGLLLAALGRSWAGLGPSLGRSWVALGRSWAILGPPEAILDRLGGGFLVDLGSIWGGFGSICCILPVFFAGSALMRRNVPQVSQTFFPRRKCLERKP